MDQVPQTFDAWAIVEIMGHDRYAGHVTEQTIGGCAFVRIDVPECDGKPAFTKLFGQGAIFSLTPVSEEIARAAAKQCRSTPINVYGLLPSPAAVAAREYQEDLDYDDPSDRM